MSGWTPVDAPRVVGSAVTLVEGAAFCISKPNGDFEPGAPHGLFYRDTRILSGFDLRVDGASVEALASMIIQPFSATFVCRHTIAVGPSEATVVVQRERSVGTGLREDVSLRNFSATRATYQIDLLIDSDFADLFEVKEGRAGDRRAVQRKPQPSGLELTQSTGQGRGVFVQAQGAEPTEHGLRLTATIASGGRWSATILVTPILDGRHVPTWFPIGRPVEESVPARRLLAWRQESPIAQADDPAIERTLQRSRQDLGALRIFDGEHPDRAVVAAGAPWFMALFGRDSLLTALMALPLDQRLALGTLLTLAGHQGQRVDPQSEEEPGKILHEVRLGVEGGLTLGGSHVYYGSVDATPLFVVLLHELRRFGLPLETVEDLLPAVDRALAWIIDYGDRDGDGFVEYHRANPRGLANQGWKDSWDGINFADGRIAEAPIALCEVQGYVYAAYLARGYFAEEAGDPIRAAGWRARAAEFKEAFNAAFWMPDRGYFAIALDRDKRPVDSCASNMGHCLWSGIVDADKAALVADRLMSPEMFSGWGVRTLGTTMGAYNPVSYHNGSVWPHDNAIIASGLMRYGFVEAAQRIATGLFDAAEAFDGRLPELFCGFDRAEFPEPVPYPTSCSPQAWAAATPVHLLRTLLRFEPEVPTQVVYLDPALPASFGRLQVSRVPLGGSRLDVHVVGDQVVVEGLPPGIRVARSSADGRNEAIIRGRV